MKSQGLPMSTIVIVIVALIVLTVILFMWIGGGGKILGSVSGIVRGGTPTDKSSAIMICEQLCDKIKFTLNNIEEVSLNDFCIKSFDLSKDNVDYPVNDHCYIGETAASGLKKADGTGANEQLAVKCSLRLANGKVCTNLGISGANNCCGTATEAACSCS
jgi:hypothetical protein